jgi:hypothetical protein
LRFLEPNRFRFIEHAGDMRNSAPTCQTYYFNASLPW